MKRICVMILTVLAVLSLLPAQAAAASDFEIENGVLIRYSGSASDVNVPDGVTEVGASAFENNTNLRSVTLPSSVYTVGDMAFNGCTSLKSVVGGENVTQVGAFAFHATPYLNDSVDKYFMLGRVLLWYNGAASAVSIPTSCVSVAPYAFARCDYLTSFNAYDGLLSIGTGAFYGCSALDEIAIPKTVSEIGGYAFDGTPVLDSLGDYVILGDGVLVKYQGTQTELTIPDSVRRIAPHAFTGSKLKAVTVPGSVYSIDAYAFADCVGLTQIDLSDGLVMIGDGAFRGCKSLSLLKTPETLSYIGQYAFRGDAAIDSASLSGDELTVSYNAFQGCTGLRYALITDGVSSLYSGAFDGCSTLEGIALSSGVGMTGASLSGCDRVTVYCDEDAFALTALPSGTVSTLMGDTDGSGALDLPDATAIQRFVVFMQDFSGAQSACADVNFDGVIDTLDAYHVQLKLTGLA